MKNQTLESIEHLRKQGYTTATDVLRTVYRTGEVHVMDAGFIGPFIANYAGLEAAFEVGELRTAAVADPAQQFQVAVRRRTPDHSQQIAYLRGSEDNAYRLAADLLEMHDATGISLDDWESARVFVESLTLRPITPNHA